MLLTTKELKAVAPYPQSAAMRVLANWGVLHTHLVARRKEPGLSPQYVLNLLRIELATRKRLVLATRLLGVYHRLAREENERRLAEALGDK